MLVPFFLIWNFFYTSQLRNHDTDPLSCPILCSIGTQLPAQLMCRTKYVKCETLVFDSPKIMLLCHGKAIGIVADNMQNYHSKSGPLLIYTLTTSVLPKYIRLICTCHVIV